MDGRDPTRLDDKRMKTELNLRRSAILQNPLGMAAAVLSM
jgi:hypothetical protein